MIIWNLTVMSKHLRRYLFISLLILLDGCGQVTGSKLWSPSIEEMISIANMSHERTLRIMKGKGFEEGSSETHYGQRITMMGLKDSTMDVSLIKSQWKDKDSIFQMVHLDIKPVSLCDQLLKELKSSGFRIKEQHVNDERSYWLLAKDVYTVSIYKFKSRSLPLSVELHEL